MALKYLALFIAYAAAAGLCVFLCIRYRKEAPVSGAGLAKVLTGRILWSAFAAAFLFLAAESAIVRRLGPDLFLPAAEGQPLPMRAVLQSALLALCFAGTLTGRGRALSDRVRAALQRDRACWLAAAIVTAVFFLWVWRVTVIIFMTNDDVVIMQAIGEFPARGLSAVTNTFSSPLFCAMLGLLYRAAPGGYWYAWYQLAVIAVSLTIIGRCIHLKLRRHTWPAAAGFILHGLLACFIFLYPASSLSFTVTSALAGTGAVALLLCRNETQSVRGQVCTDAASLVLMILCFLQRDDTGTCLVCFWALAAGYQLVKLLLRRETRRTGPVVRLIAAVLVSLALFGAVTSVSLTPDGSSETVMSEEEKAAAVAYQNAESCRSAVMDIILPKVSNEQLEEAVGIPPELSTMLRAWYFMDERITTNLFERIINYYRALQESEPAPAATPIPETTAPEAPAKAGLWDDIQARIAAATPGESAGDLRYMKHTAMMIGVLAVLALLSLWGCGRRHILETLCALCAGGGAVILWAYLIWVGRFPLRVFEVVTIPAIVSMLLLVLDGPQGPAAPWPAAAKVLSWGMAAVWCVLGWLALMDVPNATQPVTRTDLFYSQNAVESFVNARPEVTFITGFSDRNLDPFHNAVGYPVNMSLWGGVGVTASENRLYSDFLFQDNVLLMYENPSTILPLLQYLSLDYGPVQAQVVSQLTASIFVVDLSQVTPGGDQTGWYEKNGMTYYFIDGQAVTGTQTIDGTEYTFAPIGDDAMVAVSPDPDGIIYSTDAYSLVTDP